MDNYDHEVFCAIMQRRLEAEQIAAEFGLLVSQAVELLELFDDDADSVVSFLESAATPEPTHEEAFSFFIN